MNGSMISSSVSMTSLQQKLDLIANNISNLNTAGYKKRDASFQDVLTSTIRQHPDFALPGRLTPSGLTIGNGARLNGVTLDMTQGQLKPTDQPLDVAIEGNALLEVGVSWLDENGQLVAGANGEEFQPYWLRGGSFQLSVIAGSNNERMLTTTEGYPLRSVDDGFIIVPAHSDIQIDARGIVTYTNEDGDTGIAGQLRLMRVQRPDLMVGVGHNLFAVSGIVQNRNTVIQQVDFEDPANTGIAVRQFFTEQSNVDLATELTELISVQRAYELNARVLSSGDQMMNLVNNLRV